jgi:hypothetical protein
MLACQAEHVSMDQVRARKTFTYKLMSTAEQEQAVATVVWRCGVVAL